VLGVGDKTVEWKPDEQRVARLKKHLAQFFALATGGPTTYEGRDMKEVHGSMKITNVEFDAAIGDLQASLDKLGIPTDEQKELLAVIESTRQQVATQR
jgi:hemoglobin